MVQLASRHRLWTFTGLIAALLVAAGLWLDVPARRAARAEVTSCPLPREAAGTRHAGMVWVPAGSFDFGDTVYPEEQPTRRVSVAGFWMDRTEVTNDQFAAFVKATGYVTVAERAIDAAAHPELPPEMRKPGAAVFVVPKRIDRSGEVTQWWRYIAGANWRHPGGPGTTIEGRGAYPAVAVTIEDARAYAAWKGHALPSEAQWEWAARGGRPNAADDHEQPKEANTWQGIFPVLNSADDGFVGLAPVGCYAANGYGLFDMIGNAWELTADAYTPAHVAADGAAPDQIPPGLRGTAGGQRVIKGGSFLCSPDYCMRYRAGSRQPQDDDLGASHLGFRTILAADGP